MDVTNAKLRKSQKKVIKNFNKYITTGIRPNTTTTTNSINRHGNNDEDNNNMDEQDNECLDDRVKGPAEVPKMDISFTGGLIKGKFIVFFFLF